FIGVWLWIERRCLIAGIDPVRDVGELQVGEFLLDDLERCDQVAFHTFCFGREFAQASLTGDGLLDPGDLHLLVGDVGGFESLIDDAPDLFSSLTRRIVPSLWNLAALRQIDDGYLA